MCRDCPPSIQRPEQAVNGCLQCQHMEADVAGFSERLINCRFERDDAAKEFNPLGLRLRRLRPRQDQHSGEAACGLGYQVRECRGEPPPRTAEIGPGEDHARARDPDADLAIAPDRHPATITTYATRPPVLCAP